MYVLEEGKGFRPLLGSLSTGSAADGLFGAFGINTIGFGYLYNSVNNEWDRHRANDNLTVLSSAARTATTNSSDIINYNWKGLHLITRVSALTATPSITVSIEGKDTLSGQYYTILTSASITTVSVNVLKVYPGITAIGGISSSDIIPREWRVTVTHADADSITYSVAALMVG